MLAVGLAGGDSGELGRRVLQGWDDFLTVVSDPATDLEAPSRLKGWTGADVCIHLGQWADSRPLEDIVESARSGDVGTGMTDKQVDAKNDRLVQAHRGKDVLAALRAARTAVADFLDSDDLSEIGLEQARSPLGPLPVLTILNAGVYELAVHALDLEPCGAPRPSDALLDQGLAALLDVTGALAHREGVHARVLARTPAGGWTFESTSRGWTTEPVDEQTPSGATVRAEASALLDASCGRIGLPQALVKRTLVVSHLPSFMKLAPLLDDVPGLPGGRVLKAGAGGLGKISKVLRLGR